METSDCVVEDVEKVVLIVENIPEGVNYLMEKAQNVVETLGCVVQSTEKVILIVENVP